MAWHGWFESHCMSENYKLGVYLPCLLVDVSGQGRFVLSTDEIFAIDTTRLKAPVAVLSIADRAKNKPAIGKVIGEY